MVRELYFYFAARLTAPEVPSFYFGYIDMTTLNSIVAVRNWIYSKLLRFKSWTFIVLLNTTRMMSMIQNRELVGWTAEQWAALSSHEELQFQFNIL